MKAVTPSGRPGLHPSRIEKPKEVKKRLDPTEVFTHMREDAQYDDGVGVEMEMVDIVE